MHHTTGRGPTHSICPNSVLASQYIDDCHISQMRPMVSNSCWSNLDLAKASVSLLALVLVLCGSLTVFKKSILIPVQVLLCMGFISDSAQQAFLLP